MSANVLIALMCPDEAMGPGESRADAFFSRLPRWAATRPTAPAGWPRGGRDMALTWSFLSCVAQNHPVTSAPWQFLCHAVPSRGSLP